MRERKRIRLDLLYEQNENDCTKWEIGESGIKRYRGGPHRGANPFHVCGFRLGDISGYNMIISLYIV